MESTYQEVGLCAALGLLGASGGVIGVACKECISIISCGGFIASDIHSRPREPTTFSPSTPSSFRMGSTMWSRGVAREVQHSRGAMQSGLEGVSWALLPPTAEATLCTVASVELPRFMGMAEPAEAMPAPARVRAEMMEKRMLIELGRWS